MADFYDLIVIGGGPGGYVAALRASQLGMKVALVESAQLGGVCLNWGCIPTKALLRAAELYSNLFHLHEFGLSATNPSFDLEKVVARSRHVAQQMGRGVGYLMKKAGITVVEGHGRLDGKKGEAHNVQVLREGEVSVTLQAPHVILATGARARQLPGLEQDGKLIWGAREAMTPASLPKRLLVIGSGAIGTEFASFYRDMGSEVTIAEVADRILVAEDAEISQLARKAFEKRGMKIHTATKVGSLHKKGDEISTTLETPKGKIDLTVDRVICAVGVQGNTENLGLEKTAVQVEGSFVVTDEFCRTGEAGIYAIGDLAGPPCLAHKASHEGVICVEKISGRSPEPLQMMNIPGCTYSRPQIASVGLTEAQAAEKGRKLRIGRFPFRANGKAVAMGEPDGLTKTIFDAETGELLGAHMIGAEVTEMIQGFVIARTGELTEAELAETVFPHPTISETMHESVLAAHEGALHI
ncbi:dihydrolipoyl dehydrogenase [Oecophyllibacter saccharovorans]|uniref:Dihydrolipoyl dehydrogenase n=1 Tax=Oecophyllibacter saccharovorans TaxID=2558360 RepID=A0A506UQD6_9PROT|nr:dihydrolipoyl dehydrogenase [Oecophyllibacter saccharovorans]TPW35568.1 dihydrolipoyl dehydrogenase [Oecophyllibacter saccharovorans]